MVYWAGVSFFMYIDNRPPRAQRKLWAKEKAEAKAEARAKAKSAPESILEHRTWTLIWITLLTFYVAVAGISHLISIGA